MRVGILNNLRAGRSGATVSRVLGVLRSYPRVAHVETETVAALPEALSDLARQEIDLLVVNGGDGTLQHSLTEILRGDAFERIPLIAPLRGGRTNMAALDLGARRDPAKGVAALLAAVDAGRIAERFVSRPVLRVNSSNRRETYYGMFFGAGMIHRAVALTHRLFPSGRSQGVLGAGVMTGTLVAKAALQPKQGVLRPDKAQILLNGEMVPQGEFYMVIASTLRRLFLRMNPFWGRGPGAVRFTCVASSSERYALTAPGILAGRAPASATPERGYTSENVERAELHFDCGFTIDGEIFPERSDETVTLTGDRRTTFVRA